MNTSITSFTQCPFCGDNYTDDELVVTGLNDGRRAVFCSSCGARGPAQRNESEAKEAWGQRAVSAPHAQQSILTEAAAIINGPRRAAYGPVEESFGRIANVWNSILRQSVTARQVALCMIALKLLREANEAARDNRVDICGYTALLDALSEGKK